MRDWPRQAREGRSDEGTVVHRRSWTTGLRIVPTAILVTLLLAAAPLLTPAPAPTTVTPVADIKPRLPGVSVPAGSTADIGGIGGTGPNHARFASVAADSPIPFSLKVDFSDAATAPATGYIRDSGERLPGGPRLRLGRPGRAHPGEPGRQRPQPQPGRRPERPAAGHLHARAAAGRERRRATPGAWEAAVPTGTYTVTVAVGDAGTAVDSAHWVNIEDQNAIAAFVPTASGQVRHRHPHGRGSPTAG